MEEKRIRERKRREKGEGREENRGKKEAWIHVLWKGVGVGVE